MLTFQVSLTTIKFSSDKKPNNPTQKDLKLQPLFLSSQINSFQEPTAALPSTENFLGTRCICWSKGDFLAFYFQSDCCTLISALPKYQLYFAMYIHNLPIQVPVCVPLTHTWQYSLEHFPVIRLHIALSMGNRIKESSYSKILFLFHNQANNEGIESTVHFYSSSLAPLMI